jgi:phenylacetate-coenzyme A ligase PaaK-like adenylate-forming protein
MWGGRFKDLLASQGKRFQVTELEGALRKIPEINEPTLEYAVVKPAVDDAPLVLRVECARSSDETDEVRVRCVAAVREQLGIAASVEVLARDTLPRSGYKVSRVVDA